MLLLGAWLRRAAVWLVRALPAIATGLAAAIPVLVSTAHAVSAGWEPAADDGIIVTRAWDVLTSHSPLVGQYSEAGTVTGQVVHSPGPLLYWLLAIPARFGTVSSIAVWMGAVNTLAIIACVALARRRGGLVLMFAAAIGIALMCQSLAAESFHDVWNPAAALFPFLLLIFLCWSLACGDHRLLPLTMLDASFVTQTHLTYVAPTAGLLAIGIGGLVVRRCGAWRAARRARGGQRSGTRDDPGPPGSGTRRDPGPASLATRGDPGPPSSGTRREPPRPARRLAVAPFWRWVAAAALVLAICWAPPALDEIENNPGNLTLIVQTTSHRGATLGASIGWNAVVDAVGWKPWWLYIPASEWNRKKQVLVTPSNASIDSTLALLAALGLVTLAGLWRRRGDLAAAAAIGLVLCAALDANVSQTPVVPLLAATIGYTAWWGSMLGLWVWLVAAWAIWLLVRRLARGLSPLRRAVGDALGRLPARTLKVACVIASLGALGGTVATAGAVAAREKPDSHVNQYPAIAAIVARLDQILPSGAAVRLSLGATNVSTLPLEPGVRFGLVRHGDRVLSQGAHQRLGYYYELEDKPYSWYVFIADGMRARRHLLRVVTVRFHDFWGNHVFSAWIARVGPGRRLSLPTGVVTDALRADG
ncbi:MAG: hypothetical protein ABSD82_13625 [Solirubrobacteraceae bacterium]